MPSNSNHSAIQGLNIIYPSPDDSATKESKDFLTHPSEYSDFTAQLDLWTNLSFSSDEPTFINDTNRNPLDFRSSSVGMDKDSASVLIANADKLPASIHLGASSPTTTAAPSSNFDISSFLAGFGIDPFLVPPHPSSPQFSQFNNAIATNPEAEVQPVQRTNKRPRTRKQSVTSAATPITPRPSSSSVAPEPESSAGSPPPSTAEAIEDSTGANFSAAEDKRRRNTAASARFRAKKKEREQAMEKRSKELESRVTELERECEGLRRENGWLKGLVVGVTSGNPVPIPIIDEPPSLVSQAQASSSAPVIVTNPLSQDSAKKRKRELTHEP